MTNNDTGNRMLFINISWMKHYEGASPEDMPKGGFSYTKAHPEDDHTQFNFSKYQGHCYGHAPGATSPNLKKLGAQRNALYADGVLVVLFALDSAHKRVIVGWYTNARVWGTRQKPKIAKFARARTTEYGEVCEYSIEADSKNVVLLPPGKRPALLKKSATRLNKPGQNPFWYGNPEVKSRVRDLVTRKIIHPAETAKSFGSRRPGWLQNTEERLLIERGAMEYVMERYERDGYKVKDVSAEKRGYDIHVVSAVGELHLEVKGKKGSEPVIELTPNEYKYAKRNKKEFRICIVLGASGKERRLIELRLLKDGRWVDTGGNIFFSKEKPSLIISKGICL